MRKKRSELSRIADIAGKNGLSYGKYVAMSNDRNLTAVPEGFKSLNEKKKRRSAVLHNLSKTTIEADMPLNCPRLTRKILEEKESRAELSNAATKTFAKETRQP